MTADAVNLVKELVAMTENRTALFETLKLIQAEISKIAQTQAVTDLKLTHLASLTDLTEDFETIQRTADLNNPGEPVAEPAAQAPFESTEQAAQPEAWADLEAPGAIPGSTQHMGPDGVTDPRVPGTALELTPDAQVDVQAPVAGTQTPYAPARFSGEPKVGDGMDPNPAFPWTIQSRALASLRLAEARIQAGHASGDRFALAGKIELSNLTPEAIVAEIETYSKFATKSASVNRNDLVPQKKVAVESHPLPSDDDLASGLFL